jgi:hypothetical protein
MHGTGSRRVAERPEDHGVWSAACDTAYNITRGVQLHSAQAVLLQGTWPWHGAQAHLARVAVLLRQTVDVIMYDLFYADNNTITWPRGLPVEPYMSWSMRWVQVGLDGRTGCRTLR